MTPYNARPTAAAYAVTEGAKTLRIRAPQSREGLVELDEAVAAGLSAAQAPSGDASVNQKVAPFSTSPSAHTVPPWR